MWIRGKNGDLHNLDEAASINVKNIGADLGLFVTSGGTDSLICLTKNKKDMQSMMNKIVAAINTKVACLDITYAEIEDKTQKIQDLNEG